MKFIVHGRKFDQSSTPYIEKVLNTLDEHKVDISISNSFFEALKKSKIELPENIDIYDPSENDLEGDVFISIGGDGTLLESVTHIGKKEIPILGINTGRLGFLATTQKSDISKAIKDVVNNNYSLDVRTLLRLNSDQRIFGNSSFALNEFTILKKDTSSMIVVDTFINDEYLSSYWADGLIVSTATGSTGYSLSCGGPVVHPQSDSFIITPVSPHNLTMRPLVLTSDSRISFKIGGRSRKFLVSLDSRSYTVDASIKISLEKEDFKARLIKLDGANFINTLREKLNWGLDLRN